MRSRTAELADREAAPEDRELQVAVGHSPFCLLDEVDAALDEANTERFGNLLSDFVKHSQFIVISHAKRTMSMANVLYGVTMQEPGVSKRISVKFEDSGKKLDTSLEPVTA